MDKIITEDEEKRVKIVKVWSPQGAQTLRRFYPDTVIVSVISI